MRSHLQAGGVASVGLLPAAALVGGAVCGLLPGVAWTSLKWALASLAAAAWIAWWGEHSRVTVAGVTIAFFCAAVILAADARDRALHTPLGALLGAIAGEAVPTGAPARSHA